MVFLCRLWFISLVNTLHMKAHSLKKSWHGLNKQVGIWAKACVLYQTSKIQHHIRAPLQTFQMPFHSSDHIHVDLVGFLPPSKGFIHLLTVVDQFNRWSDEIPLFNNTTATCTWGFVMHWISQIELPLHISSDRSPELTSQLWASNAQLLCTQLHHTAGYYPQSNGLVKCFHWHLKLSLRACLLSLIWIKLLLWVLLGIPCRTALKDDLGCYTAEL